MAEPVFPFYWQTGRIGTYGFLKLKQKITIIHPM